MVELNAKDILKIKKHRGQYYIVTRHGTYRGSLREVTKLKREIRNAIVGS